MPNPSMIAMEDIEAWETLPLPDEDYYYLSGPMTALRNGNANLFIEAAAKLRARDYTIVSPYETTHEHERKAVEDEPPYGPTYVTLIKRDLETVMNPHCIGVIVLEGWKSSKGAIEEVRIARLLGKDVLEYPSLEALPEENDDNVLAEANRLVEGGARDKAYGHPYHAFSKAAVIMTQILDHEVKPEQVPMLMIAIKLSRLSYNMKRDSLVDIAGYARTAEMVQEFQKIEED